MTIIVYLFFNNIKNKYNICFLQIYPLSFQVQDPRNVLQTIFNIGIVMESLYDYVKVMITVRQTKNVVNRVAFTIV